MWLVGYIQSKLYVTTRVIYLIWVIPSAHAHYKRIGCTNMSAEAE